MSWSTDPEGRVRNISLAPNPKNALFPLFEAVMNSIHAIEEKYGRDGVARGTVEIEVILGEGGYSGFRVRDNGIGITEENLASFRRMDSQAKARIGGKGVGRLLWLKAVEGISVTSAYAKGREFERIRFDCSINDPTENLEVGIAEEQQTFTEVQLVPFRSAYAAQLPKKLKTIANRLLAHFISYFVNIAHPKIVVFDQTEEIDLFDQFAKSIVRDKDYEISEAVLEDDPFYTFHCFLLPKEISDDEKSTNAFYLGANGRAVSRYDMDSVIGLKAIDGKYAFLGYVEGDYLDQHVNETRTAFSLESDEIQEIVDSAKEHVKDFLAPEIAIIRGKQREVILALRAEYPRFLSISDDVGDMVEKLHLATQKKEEVFVELSRQSLRQHERFKNSYKKSVSKKLPDIKLRAAEYVSGLKRESIASLAEYVTRRRFVLDVFRDSLKFRDDDKSEYEDVLHDIICPLRSFSTGLDYDDHNLWIIDDRLAFYSYFNSDIQMRKQVREPENELDRPDISVFDVGLGFENSDPRSPISIIEFKRPKIENYTLEKNPITQVRKYVESMRRSKEAIKFDGTPLRPIAEDTPFSCFIVADVNENLLSVMRQLGRFSQRAGSRSYYCWDDQYSIYIEISPFADILESAESRNRAFFERLGLGS